MPKIPDRDKLEEALAKALAKVLRLRRGAILEALGDPPDINKMTPELWETLGKELAASVSPFLEDTFVAQAGALIAGAPIGLDFALINERAITWANQYAFDLVRGINETDRRALQSAISSYFRQGQTREQLETQLGRIYGPGRASTIAVTEITRAASQGEQAAADELKKDGINMIPIWQTNNDELVCPICGPRQGKVIDDNFYPPAHTNCRCFCNHELPKLK
jgi:SPP1 gp7 family putative phage head morphogenesis protein